LPHSGQTNAAVFELAFLAVPAFAAGRPLLAVVFAFGRLALGIADSFHAEVNVTQINAVRIRDLRASLNGHTCELAAAIRCHRVQSSSRRIRVRHLDQAEVALCKFG